MVAPAKLVKYYTAEEFMALSLNPVYRYELVRGEIREMSQPGEQHMLIAENLQFNLGNFVRVRKLGRVLPPGGFKLSISGADKDTVRSPDLAFLSKDKITGRPTAIQNIPELAVEIYSPNDRPGELNEKLEDYQQAGWNVVWVIYPPDATPHRKASTVDLYRLQEETGLEVAQTLGQTEVLKGEGLLEGFSLPLSEIFDLS